MLNKILHVLPDDMIREVTSDFILKIPKSDKRMIMLDHFLMRRNEHIEEGFYSDGSFRYHTVNNYPLHFSIHYCSVLMFVEYVFGNLRTKEQTNTRIWMNGKVEDYIDGWLVR